MRWVFILIHKQGEFYQNFLCFLNSLFKCIRICMYLFFKRTHLLHDSMNSTINEFMYIWIYIYSLTRFPYFISNPINTLMKLAKGSGRRINSFEKEAHRHLQSSSLISKLTIRDDVVQECLYICNQNYDQRVKFPLCGYL